VSAKHLTSAGLRLAERNWNTLLAIDFHRRRLRSIAGRERVERTRADTKSVSAEAALLQHFVQCRALTPDGHRSQNIARSRMFVGVQETDRCMAR